MILDPEKWERVCELFDSVLLLETDKTPLFLDEIAASDPEIAEEVRSLLQSYQSTPEFLETRSGTLLAREILKNSPLFFEEGETVGDFTIRKVLGTGSFGTVYLARQVSLDREVALKVSPNVGEEAQTMASLDHDHIVKVFSEIYKPEAALRMICMQYVPGMDLEQIIALLPYQSPWTGKEILRIVDEKSDGPSLFHPAALKDRALLESEDALGTIARLGIPLADALAYAHKKGVLHLDIKPGNILITPYGRPLLADFNISRNLSKVSKDSFGMFGGTVKYMAPEHLEAFNHPSDAALSQITEQADIYSLGKILELFFQKIISDKKDSPEYVHLRRILEKATALKVEERYSSAMVLSQALHEFLEHTAVQKSLPKAGALVSFAERSPILALCLGVLIPQIIASVENIAYNGIQIVGRLNAPQRELFMKICFVWNPIIYSACLFVLLQFIFPILNFIRNPEKTYSLGVDEIAKVRRRILNFPLCVAAITTVGWFLASLLFPIALDYYRGPLSGSVYGHFFISFALSALVALTYSFVFVQFLSIRVLYPLGWVECSNILLTARKELEPVAKRVRFFHFCAGFIPLIAAVVLVLTTPEQMASGDYSIFKVLVISLISAGMLGIVFSLRASNELSETLVAFTGIRSEEK